MQKNLWLAKNPLARRWFLGEGIFVFISTASDFPHNHSVSRDVRLREWPSGLYSLRQVTEVKLGRVRSDFGWVTSEA